MLLVTTDPVFRVCTKWHQSPLVCWMNVCIVTACDLLGCCHVCVYIVCLSLQVCLSLVLVMGGNVGSLRIPLKCLLKHYWEGFWMGTIVTLTSHQEDSALLVNLSGFL